MKNQFLDFGFNIFLTAKVSELPHGLLTFNEEQKNKTLCLIGSGGKSLWGKLPHPIKPKDHPIDQYTIKVIEKIFQDDYEILYPNDQHTLPLQKLGRFFNFSSQSPLGLDMNSEFGLWFAYRGVFLTTKEIPNTMYTLKTSACETCIDHPCLQTIDISEGRLHCPIKIEHQYSSDQRNYHHQALNILKV